MKLSSEVAKLWWVLSFICPLSARCTPTIAPATHPNKTAQRDKFWASIRSRTETKTAKTVTPAAVTRLAVMCFFPPPVKPMRSTISDAAVCPAIEAT